MAPEMKAKTMYFIRETTYSARKFNTNIYIYIYIHFCYISVYFLHVSAIYTAEAPVVPALPAPAPLACGGDDSGGASGAGDESENHVFH